MVLLAEYRGTKVAIKRAIDRRKGGSRGSRRRSVNSDPRSNYFGSDGNSNPEAGNVSLDSGEKYAASHVSFASDENSNESPDLEACQTAASIDISGPLKNNGKGSFSLTSGSNTRRRKKSSTAFDLGYLAERFGDGRRKTNFGFLCANEKNHTNDRFETAMSRGSGTTGSRSFSRTIAARLCPGMDEQRRRKEEFIAGKCTILIFFVSECHI